MSARADSRGLLCFLDVGQGDAIYIRTPSGANVLIDGGPDASVLCGLGKYIPWPERRIDLMILTHPHDDHAAGLNFVLDRYDVDKIFYPGTINESPVYAHWQELIRRENAEILIAGGKFDFVFGDNCRLRVLRPFSSLAGRNEQNPNNSSVAARFDCAGRSFLLTGDIEAQVEKELANDGLDLRAQILKAAHHGSDTSNTQEFLDKVQASSAVISVGENSYGHPSLRVLRRLERSGTVVRRTDQEGDICFDL